MHISIPSPCSEDWNAMLPEQEGRHCLSCAKTVVDFTAMNDDEVRHYLMNASSKVCGRFRSSQLQQIQIHLPENIYNIPLPLWKAFLLACAVAFSSFLFSCNEPAQSTLTGVMVAPPMDTSRTVGTPVITSDTIPAGLKKGTVCAEETIGIIAFPIKDTVKDPEPFLTGEIAPVPRKNIAKKKNKH